MKIKSYFGSEQRQLVKKYIFPYKFISQLEHTIIQQNIKDELFRKYLINLELDIKKSGSEIGTYVKEIKLSDKLVLKKYKLTSGFYAGINDLFTQSGYIDFYKDNLFVVSSRGILAFKKNISDNSSNFKQIKNNIDNFINIEQFNNKNAFSNGTIWFSIKDLVIINNKIFISFTEEIKKDCWNTSIIHGNIDFDQIVFKKLFSPKECIHSSNNLDKEFNAVQSGGRMVSFDNDHILFSTGDYRSRYLAQNEKSVNGKIIKINIRNGSYEVVSIGHRNPQGLFFDKERDIILETEHGPLGGDEINLIYAQDIRNNTIPNYGWAISSYGNHYVDTNNNLQEKYNKYPLHKTHIEYGFSEPIKAFVPSIGVSEIGKIGKYKYVLSSLGREAEGDKSIYFFELNDQNKIENIEQVKVFERVRDLKFYDNKLYLFMESTGSIGVINLDFMN